jgi:hypothetical protein
MKGAEHVQNHLLLMDTGLVLREHTESSNNHRPVVSGKASIYKDI